jgi:hypothetical protein
MFSSNPNTTTEGKIKMLKLNYEQVHQPNQQQAYL